MTLAFQRLITPAAGHSKPNNRFEVEDRLNVAVVFTSETGTIAALKRAGALADRLAGRITLIVPQIVPYPVPLESPPILLDFSEHQFHEIAEGSPVETAVEIYLCRDRGETVEAVLERRSLVVIGGSKRWWQTAEQRLARRLRRAGHEVIFTETE